MTFDPIAGGSSQSHDRALAQGVQRLHAAQFVELSTAGAAGSRFGDFHISFGTMIGGGSFSGNLRVKPLIYNSLLQRMNDPP
jgi:hypothetical protein